MKITKALALLLLAAAAHSTWAVASHPKWKTARPATVTICVAPTAATITCDRSKYTWSNSPVFTFTAVGGFGAGRVRSYKYAWDQSPTHAWTGSEASWTGGTLPCTAGCQNSWYLHVKDYNSAGAASGTLNLGPYNYRPSRVSGWSRIFEGIESAWGSDTSPRLMRAFAFRVDLRNPAIRMFASPGNGNAPYAVTRQTTPGFLIQYGLKAAVNANFFYLTHPDTNPECNVWGLLMSNGTVVSGPHAPEFNSQLLFTKNNVASILGSKTVPAGIYTAVGGWDKVILQGGVCLSGLSDNPDIHPRTGLGLTRDGRYLIMCVIDGRQEGWSMGCTLAEVAQWMLDFGAWTAMNCDGGGSSCLVKSDGAGGATVINKPSQGKPRANGANLGVYSTGCIRIFDASARRTNHVSGCAGRLFAPTQERPR